MKKLIALTVVLTFFGATEARQHKYKYVPCIHDAIKISKFSAYDAVPYLLKRTDDDRKIGRDCIIEVMKKQAPSFFAEKNHLTAMTKMVDQYVEQVEGGDFDYVTMQLKVLLDDIARYKRFEKIDRDSNFIPRNI